MSKHYPLVLGEDLRAYFHGHTQLLQSSWLNNLYPEQKQYFRQVTKPLHVFKKVFRGARHYGPVIANLIIPTGAHVYHNGDGAFDARIKIHYRKMRASKAYVHSLVPLHGKLPLKSAVSGYSSNFVYRPGESVVPTEGFSYDDGACGSGIHFFLNLADAMKYDIF